MRGKTISRRHSSQSARRLFPTQSRACFQGCNTQVPRDLVVVLCGMQFLDRNGGSYCAWWSLACLPVQPSNQPCPGKSSGSLGEREGRQMMGRGSCTGGRILLTRGGCSSEKLLGGMRVNPEDARLVPTGGGRQQDSTGGKRQRCG